MASILVDNNLPVQVSALLTKIFPGSRHVAELGMETATDTEIWFEARQRFEAIITKDKDFYFRTALIGAPPKFIWIIRGNCRNKEILELLEFKLRDIENFLKSNSDIMTIQ